MSLFFINTSLIRRLYYKLEDIFTVQGKLPPIGERKEFDFPSDGRTVSVEMALNSRCNSDYDGNPKRFHWGMFDVNKKLSQDQIKEIITLSQTPRFSENKVEIQSDGTTLTFIIDNNSTGIMREWLMIESGMQQQAVGLVCAALGTGIVFNAIRGEKTVTSAPDHETIKVKLDAMMPSYDGSFWSSAVPHGLNGWLKGNLSDPQRDGAKSLIETLKSVTVKNENGSNGPTSDVLSQLLWAARGRTPHYYKSRPWGMTIPTSRGEQNNSSIYIISKNNLAKYINWNKNRPTHSLETIKKIEGGLLKKLRESFQQFDYCIVIGRNEISDNILWKVGYQLLNLMVQAKALDIPYKALLLDQNQKEPFEKVGIKNPSAVLLVTSTDNSAEDH